MQKILTAGEKIKFNSELIKRRGLIRAKYHTWRGFRNGIIAFANEFELHVIFQTKIHTTMSYYTIRVDEVAAGSWDIIYTFDFSEIYRLASKKKPVDEKVCDGKSCVEKPCKHHCAEETVDDDERDFDTATFDGIAEVKFDAEYIWQ